jgi:rSAM/selenodomain-associated transferase 2
MISVVIPTLNAENDVGRTLSALIPAAVQGLVRQVIVVDGGSTDATLAIAEDAGADVVNAEPGRGAQLKAGAAAARFPWLLFLHADTVLEAGWEHEAALVLERVGSQRLRPVAGAFRFALDDLGFAPRVLETLVSLRTHVLKLPYGDQGLLMPRTLYDEIGGYSALPLMEDVDLVRRLGWRRILPLRAQAVTSPARFRDAGYVARVARNQACLYMYYLGVPVGTIARFYDGKSGATKLAPQESAP